MSAAPPERESEWTAETILRLVHRAEFAEAAANAALDALRDVTAYVSKRGGFMEHQEQLLLWRAQAIVEDSGRKWK